MNDCTTCGGSGLYCLDHDKYLVSGEHAECVTEPCIECNNRNGTIKEAENGFEELFPTDSFAEFAAVVGRLMQENDLEKLYTVTVALEHCHAFAESLLATLDGYLVAAEAASDPEQ